MDFTALQARAALLASLEGWTDVSPAPTWSTLANQGWYQFSWDSELITTSQNVNTVSGTLSYTLTGHIKRILDVVYDTASTKSPVVHSSEDYERYLRADWRVQTSGTPVRFTFAPFNTISLVPPPDAVKVVSVRAIVQGSAMTAGTDQPGVVGGLGNAIPDIFHEAVAIYAAYIHGKVYAQGPSRSRLDDMLTDYKGFVAEAMGYAEMIRGGN